MMLALSDNFFTPGDGPITGLFDDHWQTICCKECDLPTLANVEGIDKGSNFRSVPIIVDVLNTEGSVRLRSADRGDRHGARPH